MIRKLRSVSKFMMSSTGKLVITIYILPNKSRSKGNQALDLGQLIENNIRNIFLEKSNAKCGSETSS